MGRFVKGQSGNPGGRPKAAHDLKALAQEQTAEAVKTLIDVMKNGDKDAARVAAASALLDRGYGKPMQSIDVTQRRAVDEIPEDLIDAAIERLAAAGRPATEGGDAPAATGASEPEQTPPVSTVH
jgi:hypothetical protein